MLRAALLCASALCATAASAQDWATPEFCTTPPRPVTSGDVAPHDLQALQRAAADIPNRQGRYWRVETQDGAVSHLWGTFHVSSPAILDLPTQVTDQIKASRAVALEIDFTFPDRTSFLMQHDLPGRYQDPGDPFAAEGPLDLGFVSPRVEGWIYDRLYDFGTFDDALFVLTYAGLAELLLSDPCEDYTGGVIPKQDSFIHTFGHISGAEIIGLESPGQFLTDLTEDEETAKGIVAVYASYLAPPASPQARAAALQLYLEGQLGLLSAWDLAHVTEILGPDGVIALEKTNAYLIDDRNERFLERLRPEIDQGDVFIAVGAAHLPGENGMVALLSDAGYTVTRVTLQGELE